MTFVAFAQSHGLIIRDLIPGRWVRVPTVDKPNRRNGAYKLLTSIGWIQNHATMTEPVAWRDDGATAAACVREIAKAREDQQRRAARAARKAEWILSQCELKPHPYLERKGFKDFPGLVWGELLVVPMRHDGKVCGVQLIAADGTKRFLSGQRCNGATYTLGSGDPVLCEGFATALSVHACLTALKALRSVVACFSAHNLGVVAATLPGAVLVADNDESGTGARAAHDTGRPWWMPETTGQDFNDFHSAVGLFKASQALRKLLYR